MDQAEDLGSPALATTALWELSKRLDATPSDPWIFFRPGWRWRWRSWAEVADQVARGAEVLCRAADSAPGEIATVAFADRRDPDSLVTSLTIQAAGFRPLPTEVEPSGMPPVATDVSHAPAWDSWARVLPAESGEGGGAGVSAPAEPATGARVVDLPAVRSRFDAAPFERPEFPPEPDCGSVDSPSAAGAEPMARLARLLIPRLLASLGGPEKGTRRRPILCAGPGLSATAFQALLLATLATDTAWVLEGDPDLFPAAATWARPTALVATPEQAHQVLEEMGRARRWRRLHQVWLLSSPRSSGSVAQVTDRCSDLGVVAEPWPEELAGGLAA